MVIIIIKKKEIKKKNIYDRANKRTRNGVNGDKEEEFIKKESM